MSELKKIRIQSKMTQAELASKINVTPKYIGFLENNDRTPSLEIANKIAVLFGKSIEEIFLKHKSTNCTEEKQKDFSLKAEKK